MDTMHFVRNYNRIKTRIKELESSIQILQMYLEAGESIQAQVLTDMPLCGSFKKSKQETALLKKEDYICKVKELCIRLEMEKHKLEIVDSKLKELNDKEKYITVNVYLNNKDDKEVLKDLMKEYDYFISRRTYFYIKRKAIEKINLH